MLDFLSPREQKIRKYWAVFLWLPYVAGFLFVSLLIISFLSAKMASLALPIVALVGFILNYIVYHCAYKKHGTRWLTFSLFASPFVLFKDFSDISKVFQSLKLFTESTGHLSYVFYFIVALMLLIPIFQVVWFVLTFQLRKINKKILFEKLKTSENTEELSSLEKA